VVAPSGPGAGVAGAKQRFDLVVGEVGDQRPVEPFGWDREHSGDAVGVLGVGQRREPEQRVDRGQSGVAGADAVAALLLEVVQERADHRRVQLVDVQPGGRDTGAGGDVTEQQPHRVAVGGDGVVAGVLLPDQPVGEERLQGRGEDAHHRTPDPPARWASSRRPASAISSGAADRYQ